MRPSLKLQRVADINIWAENWLLVYQILLALWGTDSEFENKYIEFILLEAII